MRLEKKMSNLLAKRKGKIVKYSKLRYSETIENASKTKVETVDTTPFVACPACEKECTKRTLRQNLYMCPECGYHYTMPPERRVVSIVDEGSFKVFRNRLPEINPLEFEGYIEKKEGLRSTTKADEAVLTGVGLIGGRKAVIAVMNSKFLMGSMGIAVGEMVTQAIEYADKNKLPLIIFTASGGARMQEGILSLMQMAKTSAAMEKFKNNGGLYIAVMTHPTTGGVSASFASLGDITLAEPGALIGFAGPRVIEQTIRQKLPEGFQRAEFQEEHGFVDQVVSRKDMREKINQILRLHNI